MSERWFFTLYFPYGPLPNLGGAVERGYVRIEPAAFGDWRVSQMIAGKYVTEHFAAAVTVFVSDRQVAEVVRNSLKGCAGYASSIQRALPRPGYGFDYTWKNGYEERTPRTRYGFF